MNDKNPLLLPAGFYDLLPPDARQESVAVSALLSSFESFGYEQVNPPLMEFETSLLQGRGDSLSPRTFRVMDPLSQAMMGVRSDMTMQVARIASSRLKTSPRPLRLCYAGPILHIRPEALQHERQLMQAGVELIGADSLQADAEVMMVAAEALETLGVRGISFDINLPGLLALLCPEAVDAPDLQTRIRDAVSQRDSASIRRLPLAQAERIARLIEAAGAAEHSLDTLEALALPEISTLRPLLAQLRRTCPTTRFTLDPLEFRGFGYHHGISFSIFANGLRHELGRGGRYQVDEESATGFTFYVTHLLGLLAPACTARRVLLPVDAPPSLGRELRKEGWVTLYAMTADTAAEARSLAVQAYWQNGSITPLITR